jgi:broad specificity phosphatase PhoE
MGGSLREAGERAREQAGETAERLRDRFEDAGDEMARRYHQAEAVMAHYPTSSVLVGFGLGFGLGLAITTLLVQREDAGWTWGQAPDRLRRLPESLHDTLDRLAETVSHLPEAIRDYMPSMPGRR